ncbi:MAG: S8 family serine peptidase [Candidatus Eremiobacteraeota bacterium]|nr:S8 family serine peptidase [Candidatus Eremiobacteraeota bacterium]MCW5869604.1 S8 family serine peptidase [Candidatus Eremiobacteraeota bacterium]
MEIQRRPIPGSYIVAVDSRRANALSQDVRVEKVLGRSEHTAFLLVQAEEARADFMPNYEYSGDLFDKARQGNAEQPVHLDIIEAGRAWAVTRGNPAVAGAITDSGPDCEHPQLLGSAWQNPGEIDGNGVDDDGNGKVDDKSGWDFSDGDKDPRDPQGTHHTHVHGIVCARPGSGLSGVAPGSKGLDLRIAGGKRPFSSSILVESYLYALQAGVKSINTSFNIDAFLGDKAIASTYRELADQDVLLFNSAGNDSKRNPKRSQFDDLILVASTDTAEATRDQRSEFSNYGAGIDISAPGADILSTLPGGRAGALSGTSMASPVVMGVDLLVQSAHPEWNAARRWAQIAGTSGRLEGDEMGYGRVNAGRALTETVAPPTLSVTTSTFPNGQCMDLTVRFDKVLDPASAKDPRTFQVFNEQGEAVISGAPKEVRLGTNQLTFNFAKLPKGHYKFVASGQLLRDPFGQPLDGNKDGQPGDDLIIEFDRVA